MTEIKLGDNHAYIEVDPTAQEITIGCLNTYDSGTVVLTMREAQLLLAALMRFDKEGLLLTF